MKYLTLLILLLSSFMTYSYGQTTENTGTLSGKVTADGDGLPFATIQLVGAMIGTNADEQGNFRMENVPVGQQTLKISLVGYQSLTREAEI
ncbi:MAG: carboxypeptidase-like regulatory domain-containing protein, partial [Bacteroidota bacterium]